MTLTVPLRDNWEFRRLDDPAHEQWTAVELPHSPFVADLNATNHWFGECEYRRRIEHPLRAGEHAALYIGAAMHTARVFINGRQTLLHRGGYLPFEIDLTTALRRSGTCEVVLRLDNRDDPDVPPGKPFDELDFCWFGGLYRNAELRVRPAIHITDSISAHETAGGGVFIRTLDAQSARAELSVKVHLRNTSSAAMAVRVRAELFLGETLVAFALSEERTITPGNSWQEEQRITVLTPRLWSPSSPALHNAVITLVTASGEELDRRVERVGIRQIHFSRSGGFTLNGRRLRLRGTNRHQEMPRLGYALPRAAQYRDARRIKDAGFDYVRLSHYPQSPDFLDACDEFGIVVMNCIPGWQFLGGKPFRDACFDNARTLIRRDRNHPCVVLWELSLNETRMDEAFMAELHRIGHEEYPGDQMFTCGWMDAFDVFIHARQHGRVHSWRNGDKALVVSEYGDWEFYAANEGFDQKTGAGIFDRWSTARQFRADGERGLRQQALNHIVALNDTLNSPAVLDGQWAMFDYTRGYDPMRASVGLMDVFRLPKFSFYFFASQRDITDGAVILFIASHWVPTSDLRIRVFSNCEEVELRLNGHAIARQRPARSAFTQHLPHPPFVFDIPAFAPGTLEVTGYVRGEPRASHAISTPNAPAALAVSIDDLGIEPRADEPDALFVHARIIDAQGTLCIDATSEIEFAVNGAELVGPVAVNAEAGIASVVVRVPCTCSRFSVDAHVISKPTIRTAAAQWTRPTRAPRAGLLLPTPVPAK